MNTRREIKVHKNGFLIYNYIFEKVMFDEDSASIEGNKTRATPLEERRASFISKTVHNCSSMDVSTAMASALEGPGKCKGQTIRQIARFDKSLKKKICANKKIPKVLRVHCES